MFLHARREWAVRAVLRRLARQRVALVLQPGNVWVIENAVPDNEETDAALKTCFMRGWVEPLENFVPKGQLGTNGELTEAFRFQTSGPVWRLTEGGWAAIHRSNEWALIGILLGAIGVLVALVR